MRVKLHCPISNDLSFFLADVRFPKKHRPCQIMNFDRIKIKHIQLTYPQQGKILDNLITDGAAPDNSEVKFLNNFLRKAIYQIGTKIP